jgi:CHAT domain-containing protein/HEAT repeat protein
MPNVVVPARLIAKTPDAPGRTLLDATIALAGGAPLLAEAVQIPRTIPASSAQRGDQPQAYDDAVRLYDYTREQVVASLPVPIRPHTLMFSPSGRRLLVLPGGRGSWGTILVFAEPWGPDPEISEKRVKNVLHGAWLDEEHLLIASEPDAVGLQLAILHIGGQLDILVQEELDFLEVPTDASCSRAGVSAFPIASGREIWTYQVARDRSAALEGHRFAGRYDGNGVRLVVSDDGQLVICRSASWRDNYWAKIYRVGGEELAELRVDGTGSACRDGALALFGTNNVQVFALNNGPPRPWCDVTRRARQEDGADVAVVDGRPVLAVKDGDHTVVYELADVDLVRLNSDSPEERCAAIAAVARRRLRDAVPPLAALLTDPDPPVAVASAGALGSLGDSSALPHLFSALGRPPPSEVAAAIVRAVSAFPDDIVGGAAVDALADPRRAVRHGAAVVLTGYPTVEATGPLCDALNDTHPVIRVAAARALQARADLKGCPALVAHVGDDDPATAAAATEALVETLRARGLLPDPVARALQSPFDGVDYAADVLATGRMTDFHGADEPAARFFTALAVALVDGASAAADLLNAIEALAGATRPGSGRAVVAVSLTLAVILADTLRAAGRLDDADEVYQQAATLAERADVPPLRWRIAAARGECAQQLGDEPAAAAAFHEAMLLIDRTWFAVLDEDKRQHFFADKAWLYDQAMLTQLRLGHPGAALECLEKAKTRYLTDLIARRQLDARTSTDPRVTEAMQVLRDARPTRVTIGTSAEQAAMPIELIPSNEPAGESSIVLRPQELVALERAPESWNGGPLRMLHLIWELVPVLAADDSEAARRPLEDINHVLVEAREVVQAGQQLAPVDRDRLISRYQAAIRGDERFSALREYRTDWLDELLRNPSDDSGRRVLAAILEATNAVLHRETVYGVPVDPDAVGDTEGIRLTAVVPSSALDSAASDRTTIVNSALSRLAATHWRHFTHLARGKGAGVLEAIDAAPPGTALIEFAVTQYGTVTFLTRCAPAPGPGPLPRLNAWHPIDVSTASEVTTARLGSSLEHLLQAYRGRDTEEGFDRWANELDKVLAWLSDTLFEPLAGQLRTSDVTRLVIVPHRGLHLVPFAALGHAGASSRRVLDGYDVCVLPSLTLRRVCRSRAPGNSPASAPTVAADPTGDLPLAAVEGTRIAATLAGPPPARLFVGATARLVQPSDTDPPNILHYAGHGSYDWNDPLRSGLDLADEQLTLGRLFTEALPLRGTRLVTLSGCETALVDHHDLADEYLGLASGFLFSGTPTVVSSLWVVDDLSAAMLMTNFYERLHNGTRPSAALRAAQVWLRDEVDYPNAIAFVESAIAAMPPASAHSAVSMLQEIREDLLAGAEHQPEGRPFAHPCDWAAFTVSGIDEPVPFSRIAHSRLDLDP